MIPFYFGTSPRRLLGIYDPAHGTGLGARAALLCHPWGSEYLHAHRNMRQLATKLALAGYHVLRFDYFGTGDSSGELAEADVQGWVGDIEMAIDEIRDMSGATRIVLIGLRLGATLATIAASKRSEINALVLWDPVVSGAEYLERLRLGSAPVSHRAADHHEIDGFILTPRMSAELEAINLRNPIPALSARTLIISTEAPSYDVLLSRLTKCGHGSLAVEYVQDIPAWVEDLNKEGAIAVHVLRRIIQWLD